MPTLDSVVVPTNATFQRPTNTTIYRIRTIPVKALTLLYAYSTLVSLSSSALLYRYLYDGLNYGLVGGRWSGTLRRTKAAGQRQSSRWFS
ncbi:hypothetical protein GGR51DRAFT_561649 [Nemania sp. FL0031]|nr:hypothetical protein GGR51DRAFT_561649 [Nemania sp. FL0031]